MPKLRNDQVGRAGEYYVAAEICRRGGYAVTFSGNMPGIDIIASDVKHRRKVTVQVKTKTRGDWQTTTRWAIPHTQDPLDDRFWILVELRGDQPQYFVMPAWWIENDIYEAHHAYLDRNGGRRAHNDSSTHHSISAKRVEPWRDRWDILGIFHDEADDPGPASKSRRPAGAGAPWTAEEDEEMRSEYLSGRSTEQIAVRHQRSAGAIRSRLRRLGLVE